MKTILIPFTSIALLASWAAAAVPAPSAVEIPRGRTPKTKEAPAQPAAAAKAYPLKICLVSGEDLDSMDGPVSTVHQGQEFKFCCKPCLAKFKKSPDRYVAELRSKTGG